MSMATDTLGGFREIARKIVYTSLLRITMSIPPGPPSYPSPGEQPQNLPGGGNSDGDSWQQVPQAPQAPTGSPQYPRSPAQYPAHSQSPQPPYDQSPQLGSAPMPAGAASLTPEELKAKFSNLGLVNPLPALAVGGASWIGALLLALFGCIMTALAVAITGSANPVETAVDEVDLGSGDELSGIATLFRLPAQIVAMAAFGSLGVTVGMDGETIRMGLRTVPALVTAVIVLIGFFGARLVSKRERAGWLGLASSSLLAGFVVALLALIGALIFALPIPLGYGTTARIHAAGPDSFFGMWLLVTLSIALGMISTRPRPSWWPLVTDVFAGAKLAVVHALLLSLLFGLALAVLSTIGALIDGETPPIILVLGLLPLLGGQILAYLTGLPLLSAATVKVSAPEFAGLFLDSTSGTERASIFSLPWYVWILGLLIGILVTALVSLLWSHDRRIVPNNAIALIVSVLALPFTYFGGGLVLMILSRASATMRYDGSFGNQTADASVGLAFWTPLLAFLLGGVIEVLARFVAPFVLPVLPKGLFAWFRKPLSPAADPGHADALRSPGTAAGQQQSPGPRSASGS
jgi:hypothetical protein